MSGFHSPAHAMEVSVSFFITIVVDTPTFW